MSREYCTLQELLDFLCNLTSQDALVPFVIKHPAYYKVEFFGSGRDESWKQVTCPTTDSDWNVFQIQSDTSQTELTVGKFREFLKPIVPLNPNAIVVSGDYSFSLGETRVEFPRYTADASIIMYLVFLTPYGRTCFRNSYRIKQSHINPANWWIDILRDASNEELLKIPDPQIVKVSHNDESTS